MHFHPDCICQPPQLGDCPYIEFHLVVLKSPSLIRNVPKLHRLNFYNLIRLRMFIYLFKHLMFVDPIQTSVSFSIPMGQCHVPTHSTPISPSFGSIKLDIATPQVGGLLSTITITSHKHQDHSRLKDTLVPPTCQKSQLHLSFDHTSKKPSNGKKSLSLGVVV